MRRVSRAGGAEGHDPGATRRDRRRGGDAGISSWLPQFGRVLHRVATAAESDRGSGAASPRLEDRRAEDVELLAAAERRQLLGGAGPHAGGSGALLQEGRGAPARIRTPA